MNKTKIVNIIVVLLILALIGFMVWDNKKKDTSDDINMDSSMTADSSTPSENTSSANVIPVPTGVWTSQSINNEVTFDVPEDYYVSHPVIGDCTDITSISTQTVNDPTIAIALIYKAGCIKDSDVTANYTHQVIKDGYVFQTSSNNPAVVEVYNRIVASSK